MKQLYKILCLAVALVAFSPAAQASEIPGLERSVVWNGTEEGVEGYRIPGIVVSREGTVLAFAEARVDYSDHTPNHLVLKRSTDGGRSWSGSISVENSDGSFWAANSEFIDPLDDPAKKEVWANPAPVVDYITGRIFIFYVLNEGMVAGMNLQRYTRVFYRYSDDDGVNWSDRCEITPLLHAARDGSPNTDENGEFRRDANGFPCDHLGRAFHMPGPGHGIQLASGRLLLQVWNRAALGRITGERRSAPIPPGERKYGLSTIYSDDHGRTWHYGSDFGRQINMNESRMAQLEDGNVYINARYVVQGQPAQRATALSRDGGISWQEIRIDDNFPLTNQCDGGLNRFTLDGRTYLIYTKNESPEGRRNLVARISGDGGRSWALAGVIDPGPALYSDIAVLPDGTVLIIYETGKGQPVYCVRAGPRAFVAE